MIDQKFFTLPDEPWIDPDLSVFLASETTRKAIEALAAARGLDDADQRKFAAAIRDVCIGKIPSDEVAERLSADLGIDFETALAMQADLVGDVLFPVRSALAEQNEVYRDLHPEEFLPKPPQGDEYEALARNILGKSGVAPADPALRHRLASFIVARLKDVRDDLETGQLLQRPVKTGGVGLTAEQSEKLLALIKGSSPDLQTKRDELKKQEAAYVEKQKAALAVKEKRKKQFLTREDLAVGIETIAQEAIKPRAAAPTKISKEEALSAPTPLGRVVDETVAASGLALADDMQRRFRTLVELYMRDLRDALETKSKLTAPVGSGGMGLNDTDAERVMGLLKTNVEWFRAGGRERVEKEKTQYVAGLAERQRNDAAREEQQERANLDALYADIVGKSRKMIPPPPPVVSHVEPSVPKMIPVVSAPSKPAPPVRVTPVSPSAPLRREPPVVSRVEPPPNLPIAPPVVSRPEPPAPRPTPPAIRPTGPKPMVADVTHTASTLVGPVEELRALTVQDFRRLSKDPKEATLKIKDKFDLLEEQSFEMKARGIKAWQDSETNKRYLDILRRSLEGKTVADVIAEMEAKGESSLTKPEFDAVMELNRKLRFG